MCTASACAGRPGSGGYAIVVAESANDDILSKMCLIAFAWKKHPRYRLALAANRDEFHARPTAPAQAHPDAPGVHGGRDLRHGGSWLLAAENDRLAAVTNVRDGREPADPRWRSRGALVEEFVRSSEQPHLWFAELSLRAAEFGPFNLLAGAYGELHFASNRPRFRHRPLKPGMYALSNGDFDAPWPKARRLRDVLSTWIEREASMDEWPPVQPLWAALADTHEANDAELPDTGIPLALERALSAPFIVGADYGTRASSLLFVDDEEAVLHERRFGPLGRADGETVLRFPMRARGAPGASAA